MSLENMCCHAGNLSYISGAWGFLTPRQDRQGELSFSGFLSCVSTARWASSVWCGEGSRQKPQHQKAYLTLLYLTDIPSDTLKFLEISSLEDTATNSLKMETIENGSFIRLIPLVWQWTQLVEVSSQCINRWASGWHRRGQRDLSGKRDDCLQHHFHQWMEC